MNISKIKNSRYLSRGDVGQGILLTIKGCDQEDVGMEGEPEKLRWCLSFHEIEKPLVLNSTNAQLIAQFLKSEETDAWIGQKIVAYDDPSVSFGGRIVGGVRVRAPRGQAAASKPVFQQPARPAPAPAPTNPKPLPFEPEPDPSDLAGEDSAVPF